MALPYVLMPILAQAFGLNYAQVGIIRAASAGAMTVLEIPSGVLSERVGERTLLVFGLVCGGLGYLSLAAANSFLAILIALAVAGGGAAFQHSLSSSIISKTFQSGRSRAALGTYNSAGDVGKLAFSGVFTLLIGLSVAWQGVVAGFGGAALLAAIALLIVLRHLDTGGRPMPGQSGASMPGRLDWGISDGLGFSALAMIVFLDTAVQAGFLTFLAFLIIEKQVPTDLAGFAVVLTLAGGIVGKLGCGFLAERLGVIRSLVLVECLTAAGIVALVASPTLVAFFLLPVIGMALQGSSSITYGTVGDLVRGDRRSRGFAVIYSIATAAAIVAPIGFGVIADRFGVAAAMLAMACVTLLPLPPCLVLRRALAASPVT